MILSVLCRPDDDSKPALIGVEDTEDEFVIKKPETENPAYNEFLDELYKHDDEKKSKSKRDTNDADEKLTVEIPEEFEMLLQPPRGQENYDEFVDHLYRHDELKRSRRMIVFRHE